MKKKKNSGFTLIELIVAVALLGLAMGPLMGTFMNTIRTNSLSRTKLKATYLAEYMEEGFHQLTYEDYEKSATDLANARVIMAPLFPTGATIGNISVTKTDTNISQRLEKVEYSGQVYTVTINVRDERPDKDTNSSKYFVYTTEVNVYRYTNGTPSGSPVATMKGSMVNKK